MRPSPQDAIGVSELNRALKRIIEDGFPAVWVRGEVSNLRKQASGHSYFSLKDSGGQISAVLFRGNAMRAECEPRDGLQVIAFGELSVYEPRGTYQIIVRELIEDGIGRLQREFEKLKEQLRREGLFDSDRKKALPWLPLNVGVVTSPSGAAVRDMISVFRRMNWPGTLRVFPSTVQGDAAIPSLVRQVRRASEMKELDLLVVARGGGSLEDLWCFNSEKLARALSNCPLPTISAIGHETDVVLTDFVADLRKETPTGAAEWISSAVAQVQRDFESLGDLLLRSGRESLRERLAELERLRARTVARPFLRQIEVSSQRLDEWQDRMVRRIEEAFISRWKDQSAIQARLMVKSPERELVRKNSDVESLQKRFKWVVDRRMQEKKERVEAVIPVLRAGGLDHNLRRGFAIVRDEKGMTAGRASAWKEGDSMSIEFVDGKVQVRAEKVFLTKK